MSQPIYTKPTKGTESNHSAVAKFCTNQQERHLVLLIASLFTALLVMWLLFDNRLPANDEAGHILNSYVYADLLRHPKFWKTEWLCKFFTVNQFYPPTIHIFNGCLRLLVGRGRQADILSLAIFNFILSISTYGISRLLLKSSLASILAMVCVNIYPELNYLSHQYLLDYPLVAMTGVGLFSLIWWKEAQSDKRAIISGIVLGSVCMSKQIAACYLALPGLLYFVEAVKPMQFRPLSPQLKQIFLIAAIALLICLPWLSFNLNSTHEITHQLAVEISQSSLAPSFSKNLFFYLTALPHMMSYPLFVLLLLSLPICMFNRRLLPAGLSILGGILLVSSLTWIFPREQYIAPLLTPCAIYLGASLSNLLQSKSLCTKIIAISLAGISILQFFTTNFSPYPLKIIALAQPLFNYISGPYPNYPKPPQDWGQEWVIRQIDHIDNQRPSWLNVLSDTPEVNVHTFEFVAASLKSKVKPTTSRYYTALGDRLEFSEKTALYYQWYLFRSGEKGFPLKDVASKSNYVHLKNFVCQSGHFYLVNKKLLPDGTELTLYRQF